MSEQFALSSDPVSYNNANSSQLEGAVPDQKSKLFDEAFASAGLSHLLLKEQQLSITKLVHLKSGGFAEIHQAKLQKFPSTSSPTAAAAASSSSSEGGGSEKKEEKEEEAKDVIVKIPKQSTFQEAVQECLREAKILHQLKKQDCPVVEIFGVILYEDKPCIVMEKAECSLADFLEEKKKSNQKLTPEETLNHSFAITRLLVSLHLACPLVIHKDWKPANLLVFDGGKVLKICDVGIAKQTDHGDTTTAGARGFSRIYSAPEQLMFPPRISAASDCWSNGMVLVDLVTGQKPSKFVPDNFNNISLIDATVQTRDNILKELPGIAQERGVPQFLVGIIERCLQTKASERPCTARVLVLEMLESAIESGLLSNSATSSSSPATRKIVVENLRLAGIFDEKEEKQIDQINVATLLCRIEVAMNEERRRKLKTSHDHLSWEKRAPEIFMCMDRNEVPKAVELIRSAGEIQLEDAYTYYYDSKKYPFGVRIQSKAEVGDVELSNNNNNNNDNNDTSEGGDKEKGEQKEEEEEEKEGQKKEDQKSPSRLDIPLIEQEEEFLGDRRKPSGCDSSPTAAASGSGSGMISMMGRASSSSSTGTVNATTTVSNEKKKVSIAHRAVALGQVKILEALVERKAKCLHFRDGNNFTPLELSVSEGKENKNFEDAAIYFITDKAAREELKQDFRAFTKHVGYHTNGFKAINLAAIYSTASVMKAFFEHFPKKKFASADPKGLTVLLQAVDYGNLDVIEFLLDNGAFEKNEEEYPININAKLSDHRNILFVAIENKRNPLDVLELLLDKKLPQKLSEEQLLKMIRQKTDPGGNSLLHHCVKERQTVEVFRYLASQKLLKEEDFLRHCNCLGHTPAQTAMQPLNLSLLEECAKRGVLILNMQDSSRKSLKYLAQSNKQLSEMLKKYQVPENEQS